MWACSWLTQEWAGALLIMLTELSSSNCRDGGWPWLPLGMDPQGYYKLLKQWASLRGYDSWSRLWLVSCFQPPLLRSLIASSLENSLGFTLSSPFLVLFWSRVLLTSWPNSLCSVSFSAVCLFSNLSWTLTFKQTLWKHDFLLLL